MATILAGNCYRAVCLTIFRISAVNAVRYPRGIEVHSTVCQLLSRITAIDISADITGCYSDSIARCFSGSGTAAGDDIVSPQKKSIRQRYAVAHSFSGFSDAAFCPGSRFLNIRTIEISPVQSNHIGFSAVRAPASCHAAIDRDILCVSTAEHGTADSFAVIRQPANKIADDSDAGTAEHQTSGYIAGRNFVVAILITVYAP